MVIVYAGTFNSELEMTNYLKRCDESVKVHNIEKMNGKMILFVELTDDFEVARVCTDCVHSICCLGDIICEFSHDYIDNECAKDCEKFKLDV